MNLYKMYKYPEVPFFEWIQKNNNSIMGKYDYTYSSFNVSLKKCVVNLVISIISE